MDEISDTKSAMISSNSCGLSLALYLLVGAGIGAAAGLLLAPRAGNELRGDIADISMRGYEKTANFAVILSEQSRELFSEAQRRLGIQSDPPRSQNPSRAGTKIDLHAEVSPELAEGVRRLEEKFGAHETNQ